MNIEDQRYLRRIEREERALFTDPLLRVIDSARVEQVESHWVPDGMGFQAAVCGAEPLAGGWGWKVVDQGPEEVSCVRCREAVR